MRPAAVAFAAASLALAVSASGAEAAKMVKAGNTLTDQQSRMQSCSNQWQSLVTIKQTLGRSRQDFMKTCLASNAKQVPVPANAPTTVAQTVNGQRSGPPPAPIGTTAKCKDGSYWTKQEMRGACSGHGGIAAKIK